jgi:crotonobetainyl-CoA:carnitine CoA-transferase CaiB-like acyl-CoA transferase
MRPALESTRRRANLKPLKGLRILSLALNLPGPAALMRCRQMGATCVKFEPPAPPTHVTREAADESHRMKTSGDPTSVYSPAAYAALHEGVRVRVADLKTLAGQKRLHAALAKSDVLITSFRPSALRRLGMGWPALSTAYPGLSQVAIVGGRGDAAELPGHDLTYLADHGLIDQLALPPTLYADMAGSLQVSEAVLQAALHRQGESVRGCYREVALSDAAGYLALPRTWGLTQAGGIVGGAHAGYGVYACRDGRIAVAALEPHFALALCAAAGVPWAGPATMTSGVTREALGRFMKSKTLAQLARLALANDIPLHPLGD